MGHVPICLPQVMTYLQNTSGGRGRGAYIQIDYGGNKITHRYDDGSNTPTNSSTTPVTNTWYMVDVTFDGSTVKMYINGSLESTTSITPGDFSGSRSIVSVAGYYDGTTTDNSFNGQMDDVAYFNRALTASEIYNLYDTQSGDKIQDINYTYDAVGNITQLAETASTSLRRTLVLGYDDLNRLTSASTTIASTSPFNYAYTYDILGNMLTRVENGTTTTYTYATNTPAYLNPHAVATTTAGSAYAYTYDNNGNLLTQRIGTTTPASSYTWDYNNRLTQSVGNSATSTYSYSPDGQRVKMTVATTSSATTYYPSKGYNITGSVPTKNIFLPDGTLIATVVGTGTTTTVSYVHTDHLGGMNVATSDGGSPAVVELADYYPYGAARIDEQNGLNSQRKFANYEFDSASNLNYLNQRYYNQTNAKFLSQDSAFWDFSQLQTQLVDPQSWNSYAYARNNPLKYNDPDGQFWDTVVDVGFTAWDGARYVKSFADATAGAITSGIGLATNNERWVNVGDAQLSQGIQGMKNAGGDLAWDAAGTAIPFVPVAGIKGIKYADKAFDAAKVSGKYNWGNAKTLGKHFAEHGADFGAKNAEDYAKQAQQFYKNAEKSGYEKVVGQDGVTRLYDSKTNTFGSYGPDGSAKTFFKPSNGQNYWGNQVSDPTKNINIKTNN